MSNEYVGTWVSAVRPRPLPWALSTRTLLQLVLFAGIFILNFFMVTDPDLWWHLATGRYMVETGRIPRTDPFSYTAAGRPWVAHEWLAEIAMYLLYRSGGYLVAVIVFAAIVTLTFFAVFRTLRLLGVSVVATTCITFWVAAMSLAGWNVRPQVFSYLFFSLYLYLLLRSRQKRDRWLWLLPGVMALWVNLHAGYIMGLMLLGMFLFGEGLNWLRDGRTGRHGDTETRGRGDPETGEHGDGEHPGLRAQDSALGTQDSAISIQDHAFRTRNRTSMLSRRGLAIAAATVLATAVNPQGPSMLLYPLTYAGTQNASMKYIAEWQSPNFHDYFFFVFGTSMMVLMLAPRRRPLDWSVGIPVLVLTAMSLQSVRVIPFYALAVAPLLGMRLARQRPASTKGEVRSAEYGATDQGTAQGTTHRARCASHSSAWNWLLLPLCLAAMGSTLYFSDRAQLGPEPRTVDYPAAGVRYLRDAGLTGNLFNTYRWGGFLIWSFYPERKVFIDGRADMYGDQFVADYRRVYDARAGWRDVLDEHQVEVALIEKDSALATLLAASGEWQEAFRGEVEVVFVRHLLGRGG